jgi:hypothetical protein
VLTEAKRGRKPIGPRESFSCPDEMYDYIADHGKEHGFTDWSDAIRHIITEHMRNNVCRKAQVIASSGKIQ